MLLQYFLSTNVKEGGAELLGKEPNSNNQTQGALQNKEVFNNALQNSINENNKVQQKQGNTSDNSSSYFNLPLIQVDEIEPNTGLQKQLVEGESQVSKDFTSLPVGETLPADTTKVAARTNDANITPSQQAASPADGKQLPEQISQVAETDKALKADKQTMPGGTAQALLTTTEEPAKKNPGQVLQGQKLVPGAGESVTSQKATNATEVSSVLAEQQNKSEKMPSDQSKSLPNKQDVSAQMSKGAQIDTVATTNTRVSAEQTATAAQITGTSMQNLADETSSTPQTGRLPTDSAPAMTKGTLNNGVEAASQSARVLEVNTGATTADTQKGTTQPVTAPVIDDAQQPQRQIDARAITINQRMSSDTGLNTQNLGAENNRPEQTVVPEKVTLKKQDIELKQPVVTSNPKVDGNRLEPGNSDERPLQTRKLNQTTLGILSATAATQLHSTARSDSSQVPLTYTMNADASQLSAKKAGSQVARDIALPVSMPRPQWNQRFAEHISMLTMKGASHARIRLDPPELGPMAVRIQTNGGETQIQFTVTNPIARDLVDSGMQRLREMLEEHGFAKVDVDVNEYQHKKGGETHDDADENADIDLAQLTEEGATKDSIGKPVETYQDSIGIIDIFA